MSLPPDQPYHLLCQLQTQACLCSETLKVFFLKKSLLIRIAKDLPYIWQCWQLSHSANKKFSLLYLCWRAQTTIPPVYQHPWVDWDPGFNGFVASICPVQSIGAQVRWGQTPRRTRHEGYLFKDSLFSPISRRQVWLFQLPGIQIYWKIKQQTLERKPLSLDFKDSWTFVLICNNQIWGLSSMSIGVALTFDPLWSISKVTCPCRVPELISRSPGCVCPGKDYIQFSIDSAGNCHLMLQC